MFRASGRRPRIRAISWFSVWIGAAALCQACCKGTIHGKGVVLSPGMVSTTKGQYIMNVRGGSVDDPADEENDEEEEYESDQEEEEEEDDDDDEEETIVETSFSIANTLADVMKRTVLMLGKATIMTTKALAKALLAGVSGEDVELTEDTTKASSGSKMIRAVKRMLASALNPRDQKAGGGGTPEATKIPKPKSAGEEALHDHETHTDFGSYLANTYHVSVDREDSLSISGGTIGDALREARSNARLLVAFIPSTRAGSSKKITADQVAIRSLLSQDVAHAANRRSRKNVEYGSFVLWGAKAASPEAVTAIKRLKAKQPGGKNEKRPFLLVAYPAQAIDSSGKPKLVPKLLAQHHCCPPPSSESMAAWLNALRKRHAKQYASMHHEMKELQLFQERTEGYKSSVESDIQRREEEKSDEAARLAKERAEKIRLEAVAQRREQLRESLPDEPGKDISSVMTIALRFADGRSGQRRFLADEALQTIFNWVDAMYSMEREQVILTTMNGQRTFDWPGEDEETTLGSSGMSRMTGLRVSEKKNDVGEDRESMGML